MLQGKRVKPIAEQLTHRLPPAAGSMNTIVVPPVKTAVSTAVIDRGNEQQGVGRNNEVGVDGRWHS